MSNVIPINSKWEATLQTAYNDVVKMQIEIKLVRSLKERR